MTLILHIIFTHDIQLQYYISLIKLEILTMINNTGLFDNYFRFYRLLH